MRVHPVVTPLTDKNFSVVTIRHNELYVLPIYSSTPAHDWSVLETSDVRPLLGQRELQLDFRCDGTAGSKGTPAGLQM